MRRSLHALKRILSSPIPYEYTPCLETLQLCIDARAKKEGCLLHQHLVTRGLNLNIHLSTKFIIFYAKVNNMVAARGVFNQMAEKNVVSWTALLSGYAQNGNIPHAFLIFLGMHRAGVKANQFTYGSVLKACTAMGCLNRGMQIQGCIQKGRFVENLFVQSALIDLHSKCGKMEDAFYIFEKMQERDVVSWNAIVGGFAAQGFSDVSFQMFGRMLQAGMLPDCFTLGSILKAPDGVSDLMKIRIIHAFVIHLGFGSCSNITGSLIDAYARCRSIESAVYLYKNMQTKDLISCTSLLCGFAREVKCSHEALYLFTEIHQMHPTLDSVLICSMFSICARFTSLNLGRQIHALAMICHPRFDVATGNALIDMYAKSGEVEDAQRAFDEMEERNVISWTSLIAGYGRHGCGNEAMTLYKKMVHDGLKPNDVTFLCLLFSCSHAGLIVEGQGCFNSMISKYSIVPRAEHYSCLVDLFARGGHLEEAYSIICKNNIQPNVSLWGAILGACTNHANMSLGEVAATHLLDMDPENSASYVALASLYAAAGSWDDAVKIRKLIGSKSSRKYPGYSLLQSPNESLAVC